MKLLRPIAIALGCLMPIGASAQISLTPPAGQSPLAKKEVPKAAPKETSKETSRKVRSRSAGGGQEAGHAKALGFTDARGDTDAGLR